MARELSKQQLIERSLIKKYRKTLWNPFIECVQRYRLVSEGDRIAVVVDGTLASMLTAKLLLQLQRVSDASFTLMMVLYPAPMSEAVEANNRLLDLPLHRVPAEAAPSPADLPAVLGCNKLAYSTCRSDVAATTLAGVFYHGKIEGVLPKTPIGKTANEVIQPLYCIPQKAIADWARYNGLQMVAASQPEEVAAARALLEDLASVNPDVERNVLQSLHAVCRDTLPGYVQEGEHHSFLERYNTLCNTDKV